MDWIHKTELQAAGLEMELDIHYHVKFTHFNKYRGGLFLWDEHVKGGRNNTLFSPEGFKKSGRIWKQNWGDLEALLDEHIIHEVNWREECEWKKQFVDTNRRYVDVSFGFEVVAYLPIATLRTHLEQNPSLTFGTFFDQLIDEGFKKLLE